MELGVDHQGDVSSLGTASETEPERYGHLARRAEAYLRDQGGVAHEKSLIAHVFGSAGSPALWRPLLRQVLGREDGLVLRADDRWALVDAVPAPAADLLTEFVAVDVETTGLRPTRQRIIEVAAIRFRHGIEVERLETLCNPERRIPAYISKLSGITDALVAEAQPFAAIADDLIGLLGQSLIVGHNVAFDLSFINAELDRLGQPRLISERLDTMGLAVRLLPGLRKPNLHAVAEQLGLTPNPRKVHRAGADALLSAQAAMRLVGLARIQGVTSLDALKGLAAPAPKPPAERIARGRAVLDRSLLADIPKAPGVYLMRDRFDKIIYVGKAKNLRDRVASYYSQPLGYTRRMDGLLESLARIEVEVVGSELEALLLESQLIRRYQPRYNTALRSFEQYPFIRVDIGNPWPRLTLAKARKDDGARYFGPFRSTSAARQTVDLINRVIPLRTCTRSFRNARSYGSPCLELDLGRCLGPCVGRADRETYAGLVRHVVSFLDGRDEALYQVLWRSLEEAAAKLDFERAARLRRELLNVNAIVAAQRRLREAAETQTLLLVLPSTEPDAREMLLIARGRLWARFRASRSDEASTLGDRLDRSWGRLSDRATLTIDHDSVDETHVLGRWLAVNAGHPAILPLPPPRETVDWTTIVGRALALTDAELTFDHRGLASNGSGPDATNDETSAGAETATAGA